MMMTSATTENPKKRGRLKDHQRNMVGLLKHIQKTWQVLETSKNALETLKKCGRF
jgi:hypothetical protein